MNNELVKEPLILMCILNIAENMRLGLLIFECCDIVQSKQNFMQYVIEPGTAVGMYYSKETYNIETKSWDEHPRVIGQSMEPVKFDNDNIYAALHKYHTGDALGSSRKVMPGLSNVVERVQDEYAKIKKNLA
jgi:hypothetical protein